MSVTISGSGQIIKQVVQTVKTDTFSSSSTSFVDVTGLSVTITPTNSLNKILIFVDINGGASSILSAKLVRNSTDIGIADASGSTTRSTIVGVQQTGANGDRGINVGMNFMDSPATTSATTYKIQCVCDSGSFNINTTATNANASYTYRGISTITVMEVAYA